MENKVQIQTNTLNESPSGGVIYAIVTVTVAQLVCQIVAVTEMHKIDMFMGNLKRIHTGNTKYGSVNFLTDPVLPGLFYKQLRHSLINLVTQ